MSAKSIFSGLISTVFAVGSSHVFALSEDCTLDANLLQAHYSITHKSGEQRLEEHMVLTRQDGLVAHTDEKAKITDVWFQHKNQRIALTRFFDEHERGIEYEPFDLNQQQGAVDWGNKYQLVSNKTLAELDVIKTEGDGCEKIQTFAGEIDGIKLSIEWMPELRLVESIRATKGDKSKLVAKSSLTTNMDEVSEFFSHRDTFMTTDYTDIGDNESDPFLMKMVNLGFVEHGAEGFYDADGNKMGGGHGHHH